MYIVHLVHINFDSVTQYVPKVSQCCIVQNVQNTSSVFLEISYDVSFRLE